MINTPPIRTRTRFYIRRRRVQHHRSPKRARLDLSFPFFFLGRLAPAARVWLTTERENCFRLVMRRARKQPSTTPPRPFSLSVFRLKRPTVVPARCNVRVTKGPSSSPRGTRIKCVRREPSRELDPDNAYRTARWKIPGENGSQNMCFILNRIICSIQLNTVAYAW